ncbi:MAG: hypothetical protein ACSLFM_10890 [Tepidiformaceae bacterium]
MNIFFDVDYTLITWDGRLRPGVKEIFQQLRDEGHSLYLWSGLGPRWEVVERHELHDHIIDCFNKPTYHYKERLTELGVPFEPDYVIDDHPNVVRAFGGTHIKEPIFPLETDREMWRVYEEIRTFLAAPGGEDGEPAGG